MTARRRRFRPAAKGSMWAPYLLGERTPHLDPEVRAAFAGIGTIHTAAHFARAVLEGVAYSLQDTFTLFAELGIPVSAHSPGRRRRARPAVAQNSGRRLRPGRRSAHRRRRRRIRLRADGRRGRGSLGESRRGLRPGHRSGAAHRARSLPTWPRTKPGYWQWRKLYPALRGLR